MLKLTVATIDAAVVGRGHTRTPSPDAMASALRNLRCEVLARPLAQGGGDSGGGGDDSRAFATAKDWRRP